MAIRKAVVMSCLVFVVALAADGNSQEDSPEEVDCYVCMGRDLENCVDGKTHCNGYCFKVVDNTEQHKVIVKGCTPDKGLPTKSVVSDWSPKPLIELYWAKGTKDSFLKGETYFCNTNMCNAGSTFTVHKLMFVFAAALGILSMRWVLRV